MSGKRAPKSKAKPKPAPKADKPRRARKPAAPPSGDERINALVTGRPTVYRPEMCARVIELGQQGFTAIEMIVDLGVGKTTVQRWLADDRMTEFQDAWTRARELAEAFHAAEYRKGAGLPNTVFNANGKAKFMGIVFPDWRVADERRVQVTGADGGPIQTAHVTIDLTKVAGDDLDALERIARAALGAPAR